MTTMPRLRANGLRGPERSREEGENEGAAHKPRFYYPAPLRDDVPAPGTFSSSARPVDAPPDADRQRGAEGVPSVGGREGVVLMRSLPLHAPTLIAPRLPCTFNELLGSSALLAPDGTEEILFG